MENKFLDKLFEELKHLNKVPKFQLERALSPFLGIFIEEIINKSVPAKSIYNIAEFPLKKTGDFRSTNIDWLLIDEINKTLYCVELKTDSHSFRDKQLIKYKAIKNIVENEGAIFLFEELNSIAEKSNRSDKYNEVLNRIKLNSIDFAAYRKFIIVYIVPDDSPLNDTEIKRINFSQLPEVVDKFKEEWQQLRNLLSSLIKQKKAI